MKKSTMYGMLWALWLGGCLGYLGYGPSTWEFWIIVVPFTILEALEKKHLKTKIKQQ
jgi:hypothetical protein